MQKYSSAVISVSGGAGGSGATVQSYSITGFGVDYSVNTNDSSASTTTPIFTTAGTFAYTVKITDSRGRTTSKTVSVTVTAYAEPAISSLVGARCNSDGTLNPTTGTSIKATAVFTFSAVGSNTLTRTLSYKKHSSGSYTTAQTGINSGTSYVIAAGVAEISSSYDVRVVITDSLNNSASYVIVVPPVVGIAFGLNNDRARFGGPVEKAGLQVDWDAEFNGVVDVTKRRCLATLSSAGWYRVLTFTSDSVNHSNGYAGSTIDFNIGYKGQNETHKISLHIVNGRIKFDSENSVSYSQLIDKIRYTINGAVGYVDLHILGECSGLYVDFIVHDQPTKQYQYVAASLVGVDPSPSGETIVVEYTFSGTAYYKPVLVEGTANGWDYILYTDKTIEATRKITDTVSNYTTVNGFYGYYIANILTPFSMANADYYVGTEWAIGNGFSIPAAVMSKTTSKFNAYALGTASGSQSVSLTMYIKGTIA